MASIDINALLNYWYLLKKLTRFLESDEEIKSNGNKCVGNISVISCSYNFSILNTFRQAWQRQ